jgi:hypothetical protein
VNERARVYGIVGAVAGFVVAVFVVQRVYFGGYIEQILVLLVGGSLASPSVGSWRRDARGTGRA